MRTRRNCSTVSYNSEDYLKMKLDDFIFRHVISFYMYIKHFKEEDESKDHIHLFMTPNGQVDTMDLQQELQEIDLNNPLPLGCIDFRFSEVDDWILYNLHFEPYLKSKGETRVYHYDQNEIVSSDPMTLEYYLHHAFYSSKWALDNKIIQHLGAQDVPPADLVNSGIVPLNMSTQLCAYYNLVDKYGTNRAGRSNHEDNEFCNSEVDDNEKNE